MRDRRPYRIPDRARLPALTLLTAVVLTIIALRLQGRIWWCECGEAFLWWSETDSRHNSQHLLDPYSFTHVLHGLLLYGVLAWAAPRLSLAWRFCIAQIVEAAWEVFENSAFVIERYRTATIAKGYEGDSIANSLGDIACCVLGFELARRLGFRWSLVLLLATEALLLVWIRDSLLLNVVMLLVPSDAIKQWQMGE